MYLDYLKNPKAPEFANVNPEFETMPRSKSILNKECEKTFVGLSSSVYKEAVYPTTQCLRRLGNMYTAAVYGALASVLDNVESQELQGKRIALFSFGSGLAASFFTVKVNGDTTKIRDTLKLKERLAGMEVRSPQEFVDALKVSSTSNPNDRERSVRNLRPCTNFFFFFVCHCSSVKRSTTSRTTSQTEASIAYYLVHTTSSELTR